MRRSAWRPRRIEWTIGRCPDCHPAVEGSLNSQNPGSVLDGSLTVEIPSPEATITVTWHLVHDGTIVLPHE